MYNIEKTFNGIQLNRGNAGGLKIVPTEGLCIVDFENPGNPRDIASYSRRVLIPRILSGDISDGLSGPFDDRKMRYHNSSINGSSLEIAFGHSHYREFKMPFKRSMKENESLAEMGRKKFDDPFAFFPRAPGVTSAIITGDGGIVLGERSVSIEEEKTDIYQGKLHGAAGHLNFRQNPKNVDLEEDVAREIEEEFGVSSQRISKLEFVGLYSNPEVCGSDLDFGYLAYVSLPNSYFLSGDWEKKARDKEHRNVFIVPDWNNLQSLLMGEFERKLGFIFSTKAVLDSVTKEDVKN